MMSAANVRELGPLMVSMRRGHDEFAGYKNTSGATETIQIKFMVLDWNGITSTYW